MERTSSLPRRPFNVQLGTESSVERSVSPSTDGASCKSRNKTVSRGPTPISQVACEVGFCHTVERPRTKFTRPVTEEDLVPATEKLECEEPRHRSDASSRTHRSSKQVLVSLESNMKEMQKQIQVIADSVRTLQEHSAKNHDRIRSLEDGIASRLDDLHDSIDSRPRRRRGSQEPLNDDDDDRGTLQKPVSSKFLKRVNRKVLVQLEGHRVAVNPNSDAASRWSAALEYLFGIRRPDVRNGIEGSRVIHPNSRFYSAVAIPMALLLVYSAMVIPLQLSFWYSPDGCGTVPTLHFDVFVDFMFLLDITLSFFVGYYDDEIVPGYHDDLQDIAIHYMASPFRFWFDIATSIPFSFVDIFITQACGDDGPASSQSTLLDNSQSLRSIKVLRILKLLRILKALKYAVKLEDDLSHLLGPIAFKVLRLFAFLVCSVHLFACLFWRTKMEADPDGIASFLAAKHVAVEDLTSTYIMCIYFVLTVFCTVGFGDINAENRSEMLFCVFLFVSGACLFGSLISQINEVFSTMSRENRIVADRLEDYISFMNRYNVPGGTQKKIRRWVRYQVTQEQNEMKNKMILLDPKLPEDLRVALAKCLNTALFNKVPYLIGAPEQTKNAFAAELLLRAKQVYLSDTSLVADSRQEADRLIIVSSGSVEVRLPMQSSAGHAAFLKNGTLLRVLNVGDVIGECGIVGDTRWAGTYGVNADFYSVKQCTVLTIPNEDIELILEQFEFSGLKRRVLSARRAFSMHRAELEQSCDLRVERPWAIFQWAYMFRHLIQKADAARPHPRRGGNRLAQAILGA